MWAAILRHTCARMDLSEFNCGNIKLKERSRREKTVSIVFLTQRIAPHQWRGFLKFFFTRLYIMAGIAEFSLSCGQSLEELRLILFTPKLDAHSCGKSMTRAIFMNLPRVVKD